MHEESEWLSRSIDVLFLLKVMNEETLAVVHQFNFRRNAYKKRPSGISEQPVLRFDFDYLPIEPSV